jgi:hypothetical protein
MTYPTNQIPSTNPQNLTIATPIGLQSAPRDPTAQDNTYVVGSEWQNTVSKMFFKCVSTAFSGAVWTPFVPSAAGTVSELTGNSGGGVGPDGSGNINVKGDGTTINIVGNPGMNTLTASLVGGKVAAQSYVTNINPSVVPTASGVIDLTASTSTYTDGTVANTIKIELQGTNHALFVGRGVHAPATTLTAGTNGQVVIGSTGADPAFAALTSSGSTLTYTTGANTLNIDVTAPLNVAHGGTGDTSFTPYELIVANTTGTGALTQVSGVGTVNQVLTSAGAAAFPTWKNQAYVYLSNAVPAAGVVSFDLSTFATFSRYMVVMQNLFPNTNGNVVYMQFSIDGGMSYLNAAYQSGVTSFNYNSNVVNNINSTTEILLSGPCHATGGEGGVCGSFMFFNAYVSWLSVTGSCQYEDTGSNVSANATFGGGISPGSVATNIQITAAGAGGLLAFGSVSLYGMN